MTATPRRSVRVDEALWLAASARARVEGVTVTDVIVRGLAEYAGLEAGVMTVVVDDRVQSGVAVMTGLGGGDGSVVSVGFALDDPPEPEKSSCLHPAAVRQWGDKRCGGCGEVVDDDEGA